MTGQHNNNKKQNDVKEKTQMTKIDALIKLKELLPDFNEYKIIVFVAKVDINLANKYINIIKSKCPEIINEFIKFVDIYPNVFTDIELLYFIITEKLRK